MGDNKQLGANDLTIKSSITITKKVGGRIVREELAPISTNDDDGLDQLMAGIDRSEIEAGRQQLMAENPHMASMQIQEMLDIDASADEVAQQFMDPVRLASSRRVGKLADKQTQETLTFKRIGTSVQLSDDNGQIMHTLSSAEFDEVLKSGSFDVL